jgi:hypothetical protein
MFRFLSAMSGFALLGAVLATAQPMPPARPPVNSLATGLPVESVTVNGMRQVPDAVINNFVEYITSPSRAGKLTRWNKGVCPETIGLQPKFAAYVSWRVRDIATQVGAPVDSGKSCKTNVRIIFIDQPQALLDGLRKKSPAYLGYYDNEAQADSLAKVTQPIQSWYITQTQDVHGALHFDSHNSGGTVEIPILCTIGTCDTSQTIRIANAQVFAATDNRLGDGLSSVFYHVLIVADPGKLADMEIGTLADYIAMLSLSQIEKPEPCGALPSIVNMLAPDCPQKPSAMTVGDAAFLIGLYKMRRDATLGGQRSEVSYQMGQSLAVVGAKK